MGVQRRLIKSLRQYLFVGLRAIEQWYWSLNALPRRIVGWCFVLFVAAALISGVWFGCSALWHGGVAAYGWVVSLFEPTAQATDDPDADLDALDFYSGNYRHRQFPTGEKNKRRRVNLGREFNHVNDVHLEAARKLGISPQTNREELSKQTDKLVHLVDTRYYKLDRMTQSVPYLVPDAADFLTALGRLWQEYHETRSRYIITSCTRTDADVKRLRRVNVNSTKDSAHRYGTTIDITYNRYDKHGRVSDGKLKEDLARALYDMQAAGHCYVKHEVKQACFHITVRPKP